MPSTNNDHWSLNVNRAAKAADINSFLSATIYFAR